MGMPFWGYGEGYLGFVWGTIWFFACLVCLAVTIFVVFLLVRFLLVATKAAQIYVAKNKPSIPSETASVATPTVSATAPVPATSKPPAKPKSAKPAASPKKP
ncbi:MAG: hypothetical protein KF867_06540 [Cryobacterium sp.]|nr:hypothetical protein [Cryobacterium sp.]